MGNYIKNRKKSRETESRNCKQDRLAGYPLHSLFVPIKTTGVKGL